MRVKTALVVFVFGITSMSIIMAVYGFEQNYIDNTILFLIPFGIGFIFSVMIGNVLEKLTGNFFKKHYLSLPLWKYRLNVPLFFIIVIFLKVFFLKVIFSKFGVI